MVETQEVDTDQIVARLFRGIPYIGLYTTEPDAGRGLLAWLQERTTDRLDSACFMGTDPLVNTEQSRLIAAGLYPVFVTCVKKGLRPPGQLTPEGFMRFLQRITHRVDSDFYTFFVDVSGDKFLTELMKGRYGKRKAIYRADPVQPVMLTNALPGEALVSIRFGLLPLPAVDIFSA